MLKSNKVLPEYVFRELNNFNQQAIGLIVLR